MKLFVVFSLLFFQITAKSQRFIQSIYTAKFQFSAVTSPFEERCTLSVYDDTSIKFEICTTTFDSLLPAHCYTNTFLGKGALRNDTLKIEYSNYSLIKPIEYKFKSRRSNVKPVYALIFNPACIFAIANCTARALDVDFPTLKKVSPAVVMNTPQPK